MPASQKHENPHRRDRRASPPTDTDDEDPFHFDSVLTSSPVKEKGDSSPGRMLSSSVLRRASIVPVDPTAAPAPHRFSLLRERASDETIFVQEICDAEGRRWSLRVPASGLPEDMVRMLEELEKLAVELAQALPKIVVTCSAESLSLKQIERNAAVSSLQLLCPPPAVGDKSPAGCDTGIGHSLAKEKCRVVENEQVAEEPERPSEPSSIAVSSASEQSLTCIYLPEASLPRLPCSRHSDWSVSPARPRVLIGQLNVSRPAARRRLPQQTGTGNPMPTPACVLLSAQGTPTNERHHQTFRAPLTQGRNRERRGRRRIVFRLCPAGEIDKTPRPGDQVEVGVAGPEGEFEGFNHGGSGGDS